MITTTIIGTGNIARHLYRVFSQSDEITVSQVAGRNSAALKYFGETATLLENGTALVKSDIYFLAISDDHIFEVSELVNDSKGVVVHTSGSVPMQVLSNHTNYGVFYPLQTFSKQRSINFKEVPICIEANTEKNRSLLSQLAMSVSDQHYYIDSEQRKSIHLAAVFANNFTNHLYHIAYSICAEQQVPFSILSPLILETAAKVSEAAPYEMQTGPAKRGDLKTQERHLSLLEGQLEKDIYTLLSNAITKTHQNNQP